MDSPWGIEVIIGGLGFTAILAWSAWQVIKAIASKLRRAR
jgi:hypothetical protein